MWGEGLRKPARPPSLEFCFYHECVSCAFPCPEFTCAFPSRAWGTPVLPAVSSNWTCNHCPQVGQWALRSRLFTGLPTPPPRPMPPGRTITSGEQERIGAIPHPCLLFTWAALFPSDVFALWFVLLFSSLGDGGVGVGRPALFTRLATQVQSWRALEASSQKVVAVLNVILSGPFPPCRYGCASQVTL